MARTPMGDAAKQPQTPAAGPGKRNDKARPDKRTRRRDGEIDEDNETEVTP